MRGFVLTLAIASAIYATPARADPVTLTFNLHIETFDGPNPELALGVFGKMPQVGSTMRAVDRMDPHDFLPEEPNRGLYQNVYSLSRPADASLVLTVGSSTTAVRGGAYMDVINDNSPITLPDTDRLSYSTLPWPNGVANLDDHIILAIGGDFPPSTFTSDAIPPPTALQSGLRFFVSVEPHDYAVDHQEDECIVTDAFCPAFTLSGTARAVESPAPVPEPSTWILVASGVAVLATRARRKHARRMRDSSR